MQKIAESGTGKSVLVWFEPGDLSPETVISSWSFPYTLDRKALQVFINQIPNQEQTVPRPPVAGIWLEHINPNKGVITAHKLALISNQEYRRHAFNEWGEISP